MAFIHLVAQGKGGVGKSLVATVLAQWLIERRDARPHCLDLDPVNRTFGRFKALEVEQINLLSAEDVVDPRAFDVIAERASTADSDTVVDTGASAFVELVAYMHGNAVVELMDQLGHGVVIHCVLTGGQAGVDTLAGFSHLATAFPGARFVVWLNPYWGVVNFQGKPFDQTKAYANHRDVIAGIVEIPTRKRETFGADVSKMLAAHLTFAEIADTACFGLMERQRLNIVRREVFGRMDLLPELAGE